MSWSFPVEADQCYLLHTETSLNVECNLTLLISLSFDEPLTDLQVPASVGLWPWDPAATWK